MDLSKLPPAKLGIEKDPTELRRVALSYQHEYEPGEFASVWAAREMDWDFAEFIAIARAAFDVMMRRGWNPMLNPCDEKTWRVDMNDGTCFAYGHEDEFNEGVNPADWPDPFTALVEADRWYRENVEKVR